MCWSAVLGRSVQLVFPRVGSFRHLVVTVLENFNLSNQLSHFFFLMVSFLLNVDIYIVIYDF